MNNIKKLRIKRNITQVDLAKTINVKQETISAYESGKALPSADALIKIANYLNTSTDYLLGRIEEDSPLTNFSFKDMNPKTYKMINNFIMLKDKQKDDVLWYSEAIRKKELGE
jgi:transcriptional regulator with XRE-family HTH domain